MPASRSSRIETTMNTDTFPSPFEFMAKREWE